MKLIYSLNATDDLLFRKRRASPIGSLVLQRVGILPTSYYATELGVASTLANSNLLAQLNEGRWLCGAAKEYFFLT